MFLRLTIKLSYFNIGYVSLSKQKIEIGFLDPKK